MKSSKLVFWFFSIIFTALILRSVYAEEIYVESSVAAGASSIVLEGDSLRFSLSGLRPSNFYTVWFVSGSGKDMKMVGIGRPPYGFMAGIIGKASYSTNIGSVLKDWEAIKIFRHRDDNPNNVDVSNLAEVLTVDLSEDSVSKLLEGVAIEIPGLTSR